MASKKNISVLVTIGAALSSTVGSAFGSIDKKIAKLGSSLQKLKKQNADIARLQAAQERLSKAEKGGNAAKIEKEREAVRKLSESLQRAGVDTGNLAREQTRLAGAITAAERGISRATRTAQRYGHARRSFAEMGSAVQGLKSNLGGLATVTAGFGAGLGYLFKTQFLDTAAEFERLQTILKTLERGDVGKAKKAFGWISDFAADTPYDLQMVTEGFVKLRQYGIDPIAGDTLRILGDTAAGGGKELLQGVEALADAQVGQYARLKEFGSIDVDVKGSKAIIKYTDELGKERTKTVDKNNKALMRSTLLGIWNAKYSGAMKEQSKTWNGMLSNMGDQWTRFTSMVMASGAFSFLKDKMGGALQFLNEAAADGRLAAWAEKTGAALKDFLVWAWEFGKSAFEIADGIAQWVGGWQELAEWIGVIALAPLAVSIGTVAAALVNMGVAVAALLGPWGLLAAAIALGATALHENWGGIADWFRTNVTEPMGKALDWLSDKLKAIGNGIKWAMEGANELLGGENKTYTPEELASMAGVEGGFSHDPTFDPPAPAGTPGGARQYWPDVGLQNKKPDTTNKTTNVKNDFKINVTVPPGADGAAIANGIKNGLNNNVPLFDTGGNTP